MNADNIDRFGEAAADAAMKAAAEFIRVKRLDPDIGRLVELLKDRVKARLPEALDDAKAAIEANMGAMAEATFLASMRLAGIEAAKASVGYLDS